MRRFATETAWSGKPRSQRLVHDMMCVPRGLAKWSIGRKGIAASPASPCWSRSRASR
jgi:hypothetical protein